MGESSASDWYLARKVFEEVLKKPKVERMEFARELCGSDTRLWEEVSSLVDWHESSKSFLETPAVIQVIEEKHLPDLLIPGQQLLHYEIRELIGRGGMGEVYRARDTKLDRNVAIKLLRKDLVPHVRTSDRLLREARAAALLEHPNICHIYEISEADGFGFIVMQYIVGTTLDELLSAGGMDVDIALDLGEQIAAGLAEAHSRGIIHRDIKPANIIISGKMQATILDFGLAKFIETGSAAENANRMESTGGVMGTVPYMSPEQLSGHATDARTDVFSFGSLLFEMLSGLSAFDRKNNAETIAAILNEELDWLRIPDYLRPLLQRCLAKQQSDRFSSANELSKALAKVRKTRPEMRSRKPGQTRKVGVGDTDEAKDVVTQPLAAAPRENFQVDPISSTENISSNSIWRHVMRTNPFSLRDRRKILLSVFGGIVISIGLLFYSDPFRPGLNMEDLESMEFQRHQYRRLADADKREFIKLRVKHIQRLMGDEKRTIDDVSVDGIMREIDRYESRYDSLSQEPLKEGLLLIYGRATQYVPLISDEFKNADVPAVLGIYLAMVESEYHDCLVSDTGPVGLFQFTRKTAQYYGLGDEERCKVDKQARAAAYYLSDLMSEFGRENSSWTLALLSFQHGADGTHKQLRELRDLGTAERSYWAIAENRSRMKKYLESSDNYLWKFYAAAIIGETPESFGLVGPPLSTIRNPPDSMVFRGGALKFGPISESTGVNQIQFVPDGIR
jgi:serine/threonine protein kinase